MIAGLTVESFILLQVMIALGCYVQNTTGFALALVGITGVVLFDIMPIPALAVSLSFVMLANGGTSLLSQWRFVHVRAVLYMAILILPTVVLGVYMLDTLYASGTIHIFRILLGVVIVVASFTLIIKPKKISVESSPVIFTAFGGVAGLMGGLFSTPGPPLVYVAYRQPWQIHTIRNTLLAIFMVCSVVRLGIVTYNFGHFPTEEFMLAVYSFPVVFITTKFAQWHAKRIPIPWVKKCAFVILMISGFNLIF